MTSTTSILRSLSSAAGRRFQCLSRVSFSSLSSYAAAASHGTTTTTSIFRPSVNLVSDCSFPFTLNVRRAFCSKVSQLPVRTDPDIEAAFKDLMAMNWEEIPDSVAN